MKIVYTIILTALLLSCGKPSIVDNQGSTTPTIEKKLEGKFVHMVFFWLQPDVEASGFINRTEQFLKEVEVIRTYHLGTPANTPREVVDNSYSVSLVVTFDSKEDQDIYQAHAAHLKYVEEMSSSWTDVKIFDSLSFQ